MAVPAAIPIPAVAVSAAADPTAAAFLRQRTLRDGYQRQDGKAKKRLGHHGNKVPNHDLLLSLLGRNLKSPCCDLPPLYSYFMRINEAGVTIRSLELSTS